MQILEPGGTGVMHRLAVAGQEEQAAGKPSTGPPASPDQPRGHCHAGK